MFIISRFLSCALPALVIRISHFLSCLFHAFCRIVPRQSFLDNCLSTVRIVPRQLSLDGYCAENKTVFQFHSCWYHGHHCDYNTDKQTNHIRRGPSNREAADLQAETHEKSAYLRGCVENLLEIYECKWVHQCKTSDKKKKFIYRGIEDCETEIRFDTGKNHQICAKWKTLWSATVQH